MMRCICSLRSTPQSPLAKPAFVSGLDRNVDSAVCGSWMSRRLVAVLGTSLACGRGDLNAILTYLEFVSPAKSDSKGHEQKV
ncbi:hypothetical protein DOTSEDRAFT_74929 [Dothistroma septosporum NZE10]|uniref:Uncharacterized protein n=1 Tax=Dothistroma septosporum (strain NZE10 / CBS 128990) TaxID=675120 RepID=N1PD73_DOTSN|nr:hypothetical protein DOTSEDRAFT_74929 [Dothistroma septosporum NZE10]